MRFVTELILSVVKNLCADTMLSASFFAGKAAGIALIDPVSPLLVSDLVNDLLITIEFCDVDDNSCIHSKRITHRDPYNAVHTHPPSPYMKSCFFVCL